MLNILNSQWQHHVLIVTWFFKYGKPEHSLIQGNDIKHCANICVSVFVLNISDMTLLLGPITPVYQTGPMS